VLKSTLPVSLIGRRLHHPGGAVIALTFLGIFKERQAQGAFTLGFCLRTGTDTTVRQICTEQRIYGSSRGT
jgi:hypothetical protein